VTFIAPLHFIAACFCFGLACFGLIRDHRSLVHRVFAFAMVVLALETLLTGLSFQAVFLEDVIVWQRWRWVVAALLPGSWLLFSLSFHRANQNPTWRRWKWTVLAALFIHVPLATIFSQEFFFQDTNLFTPKYGWNLSLGWSGYAFQVFFLVTVVVIMMLLEKVLRESRGRQRWQVKFLVLGMGAFLAARVYTGSQILLYHRLNAELEIINACAIFVACLMILVAMLRAQYLHMEIYLSQTMLYRSLTLLIVGIYLLAVGFLAYAMDHVNMGLSLPIQTFVLFIALLGLATLFYSARLRLKLKQLISRHFRRPQYDYRNIWMDFTGRTSSLVTEKALCNSIVEMVSELLQILSVSLWVLDKNGDSLKCAGSTVSSAVEFPDHTGYSKGAADLIRLMHDKDAVVDLETDESEGVGAFIKAHPEFKEQLRIRYCVPLKANGVLLGLMTLDERVSWVPFSFEELELLKTIADHAGARLLNLKLSEQLLAAREMEAFQTIAALFVHDLKNVASKLSLLLQNMPAHFDNPDFRKDALSAMSMSVEKINSMCSRLSLVRDPHEIRPVMSDLNDTITSTFRDLDQVVNTSIVKDFHPLPRVFFDPEQIQKVLTNLLLNAKEALGDGGKVHVSTGTRNGWVEFAVSDTGCGISKEFMDQSLFRPFKTSKKQGTGIGLFHSKMIVEAHKGRIEVESREGKGSTFRVLLPTGGCEAGKS
jgi:putative PEP-CTERM system histidine kinase